MLLNILLQRSRVWNTGDYLALKKTMLIEYYLEGKEIGRTTTRSLRRSRGLLVFKVKSL